MNVSNQIIAVLDDFCRRFGIVIDWTKDNIMPYLEELAEKFIAFEVKTSWFWIYFTVAAWVLLMITGILVWKIGHDIGGFVVIASFSTTILFIIVGVQIFDLITCEVLPEKILMREIKELLDSASIR